MSNLKVSDKNILEKLFDMKGGYVLNFSDRTMEEFFKEEFKVAIYDKKYDFDNLSRSKANRLRGVWIKEDDITVGGIILALVNYTENDSLTNGKEITISEKELIKKARDIGTNLLFPKFSGGLKPEVQALQNKAQLIKEFNSCDFKILKVNERIYLLKVLYSYYEAIIRTYYGPGLFFVSSGIDDLNDYFKVLRKRLIELIGFDNTFSDIKNSNAYGKVVDQITSLYSSAEFLDVMWDSMLPSIINLREEIAGKDLFENNLEIQKTGLGVSNFLEIITKEIDALEKYLDQKAKNFYEKDLPEEKKRMGGFFDSAKEEVTKHEHKHFFENSIQEKSIDLNHKFSEEDMIAKNKKRAGEAKFPFTIQSGTTWENIMIQFTSDEFVTIHVSGHSHPTGYADMGFVDSRTHKPNLQWGFLLVLAKNGGILASSSGDTRDNFKKQKQLLSEKLRSYFGIEYDPFSPYKSGYKIKVTLIPPVIEQKEPLNRTDDTEIENMFRDLSGG